MAKLPEAVAIAGQMHEALAGRRARRWRLLGAVLAGIVALLVSYVLWSFTNGMLEQVRWQPQSSDRIRVDEWRCSSQGIILSVYAPAGVAEVWKQEPQPGDRWWWLPWRPQHHPTDFWIAASQQQNQLTLLVDYPFTPRGEWLLGLKSHDGYWTNESPYFSDTPDVSDAEWSALLAHAQHVQQGN